MIDLAFDYLTSTNTVVFLTGKAGTGKTTFLRRVQQESKKKLAVVAPTGVAAINVGGMTIHSLFQLPFGPIIPAGNARPELHYSVEKKELLSSLELLIIDEISMVRPDVLDQLDLILRNVKDCSYPFGGVQLLLIGDLSQLSPIIRDEEWSVLNRYYTSPYFFSSLVLKKAPYVRIELDKVFRQKEQAFVDILNEVRNQSISMESLELLNSRYIPNFRPTADDPYITLTTHNAITQQINNEFIEALPGYEFEFKATIKGEFPRDAYPTETELKLKIGAQVMFVKNDSSAGKLFYNGKLGIVTGIETDTVTVQTEGQEITVQAMEWTNIKYQLTGDEINETNAGSFSQIPLKLAWSITIHKSQGLSFDKAIIDVSEAFAHGQTYVALSRCRSLSGMVLRNPVAAHNIIGDPAVTRFNEQAKLLQPNRRQLETDQENYRWFLLTELFNFNGLKKRTEGFENIIPELQTDILAVADKFIKQLPLERTKKAASYFYEKLSVMTENLGSQLPALIGQSKETAAKADELINWMMTRIKLLDHFAKNDFTTQAYLEAHNKKSMVSAYLKKLNALPNEELYTQILAWRTSLANEQKVMPNMILSDRTAATIAEKLPATLKALSAIKGIGAQKAAQYGLELIGMVRVYLEPEKDQGSLF
ncbi:HRDC domain-containing protein [Mucilaginibacter sp. UR6-11]|uniref:HRDC domain-containing protein n=1 Tax=Mucilaginibacter sp. UR6-11 TaxID=1435644 RepID=UPI001E4D088F|nr:HRDC domain-containing protein [Mucilaginibacter sp. UR6-11]MCC8426331.1 AAA family ATPase [Mucilaginibacter sp. UR6-11]